MKVVFKPGNAYEEINCFDFREYDHGIVLHDEQGYNIGYVPHEILSHIEPHSGEEVAFEGGEPPERADEED
ncbi:hypothetical protein [Natrarchaeobius chitinivorans]|uniref:HIRAN domain-containing protein n=1 Tax=Natrarchaeobius chitinivorans TaxID=1679083 RepID=A0A3N6MBG9_NATCH|nr:hypothetical protein [Natrarchaeobius chitinivorans]RQG93790.1 hypothetical protein EA473_13790 [Natrarchaeobius chitinivorans]